MPLKYVFYVKEIHMTDNPSANQRVVYKPFTGQNIVQTPGRMSRKEGVAVCPFCADITDGRWPAGSETWLRPNDFPAMKPPVGECYVLLYARSHDVPFYDLDVQQVTRVVELWQTAYTKLSATYACVMTFENAGAEIGQTQRHPHGQTYGVSFLPPVIETELHFAREHMRQTGGCLYCKTMQEELNGARLVFQGENWMGFIPEWARYPFETHIYPRAHISAVNEIPGGSAAIAELAAALLRVIRGYNTVYEAPMPYMLALHQYADSAYHFHIELLPVGRAPNKLKFAASSEAAFGLWLNDSQPELKAAELRNAIESTLK